MSSVRTNVLSLLVGTALTAGVFSLMSMQGSQTIHGDVREFLSHVSMVDLPDGQGGFNRTARITGINVQVVNGLGNTETANGLGNLIVGYNELGGSFGDERGGSHNFVAGSENSYSSYGGIVVSFDNAILAPGATVTGGIKNRAETALSTVSGGFDNQATGDQSAVSGGRGNIASGFRSWVAGGACNRADNIRSSAVGGLGNSAVSSDAAVFGGFDNTASGDGATVTGGRGNQAVGNSSSVSGGMQRTAPGLHDWVAGTLFEDD